MPVRKDLDYFAERQLTKGSLVNFSNSLSAHLRQKFKNKTNKSYRKSYMKVGENE